MAESMDLSYTVTVSHSRRALFLDIGDTVTIRGLARGLTPKIAFVPMHGLNAGFPEAIDFQHPKSASFVARYIDQPMPFIVVQSGKTDPVPVRSHRPAEEIWPSLLVPLNGGGKPDHFGPLIMVHQYGKAWMDRSEIGKVWTEESAHENSGKIEISATQPDILHQLGDHLGPEWQNYNDRRQAFILEMMKSAVEIGKRENTAAQRLISVKAKMRNRDLHNLAETYGFTDLTGPEVEFFAREIAKEHARLEVLYEGWLKAADKNRDVLTRSRRDLGDSLLSPKC